MSLLLIRRDERADLEGFFYELLSEQGNLSTPTLRLIHGVHLSYHTKRVDAYKQNASIL